MSLTNAIAIIRRQDAQVKVEVPATGNRKAYSYMREGNPANPKSSVSKKAIGGAIAGAVGVGALTAGVLAMRKAKQNSDETSRSGDTVTGSSVKGAIAEGQPTQRKKPLVTPPPVSSERVLVTPAPKSIKETVKQMTNEGVTATPSKQNAVLTEPKEGAEDRKSGKTSTKKEVNLNEAAYNAGKKTRKVVEKLATLAKDTVENIKKRSKTVTAKATEVNETLPEGQTMKKAAKTPKVPKLKSPTAAEKRAIQKQLDDINK